MGCVLLKCQTNISMVKFLRKILAYKNSICQLFLVAYLGPELWCVPIVCIVQKIHPRS